MALLDGLDAIDWSSLRQTYGNASVPELLRAVADGDEGARWPLREELTHQLHVWAATVQSIPFLVEILVARRDDRELAKFLLELLAEFSIDLERFPWRMDADEFFAEQYDEPDEEGDSCLTWFRECYQAVERALPQILPFLDDDELGDDVLFLLAHFPRAAALTVPPIERLLDGPRADSARIALALILGPDEPPRVDDTVGACAAVIAGAAISDNLVLHLSLPAEKRPLAFGSLADIARDCFSIVLGRDFTGVVESLVRQLATAPALTRVLVEILFSRGAAPPPSRLSPIQRRALEAIRDHGAFADARPFADRGLPSQRAALADWLG